MNLTAETVRELLDYDPETGILTWKHRTSKWFHDGKRWSAVSNCKRWNTKYAGKKALTGEDSHGYCVGFICRKQFKSHRVVWLWMTGEWPENIDHINGIKNDNRWVNLRSVSHAENCKNMKLNKINKSGKLGVELAGRKWAAKITANGITKLLGYFDTFESACEMRSIAERNYLFHENHGRA